MPCASKETFPLSAPAAACLGRPHNKPLLRARPLTLACQEENLAFTQWGNFSEKRRWLAARVGARRFTHCPVSPPRPGRELEMTKEGNGGRGDLSETKEKSEAQAPPKERPPLGWDTGRKRKTWMAAGCGNSSDLRVWSQWRRGCKQVALPPVLGENLLAPPGPRAPSGHSWFLIWFCLFVE